MRRVLVRLQRLLAPEPAALFRLLHRPPDCIAEGDVQELRRSTEEFSVAINDIATLQEQIKLLQEEIAAQDPAGFWVVVAIVATFTLVAAWLVFFRRKD